MQVIEGTPWFERHESYFGWTVLAVFIAFLVSGMLLSFIQYRLAPRCPGCGRALAGPGGRSAIVIATGRCGGCGARVLEDGEE